PLPCALDQVLATSCRGCHAADPGLLAPMALVSYEDVVAPAVSDPQRQVFELMKQRVHATSSPMPPSGSRRLTRDELATLDGFLERGPYPGGEVCPGSSSQAAMPAQSARSSIASAADGAGADETCYRVQAHDVPVAGDQTPFQLPSGERYACFYFSVPW